MFALLKLELAGKYAHLGTRMIPLKIESKRSK